MENKFLAAAGIILLLTILSGCVSYRKRPARLYNEVLQANKTFDAGIVPGVPFKDGKWDTVMKGRVIWAALLYRQGIVRNLIFRVVLFTLLTMKQRSWVCMHKNWAYPKRIFFMI